MSRRLPNPKLVKVHRNYSVEEAAQLLHVHKNTVRDWTRRGLPTIDQRRPLLILGRELAKYLSQRRDAGKRPCMPGQIYCVRCRVPKEPAGGMADYKPINTTSGNLVGICPTCETMIYRRVSQAKYLAARGNLDVSFPMAQQHIDESPPLSVNCDFKRD